MKKQFLLLAFVFAFTIANAGTRSFEQLKAIAGTVLSKANRAKANNATPADDIVLVHENTALAVMANKGGFVVLAKDEARRPVLGYSDSQIDGVDLNPALRWWIETTTEAISRGVFADFELPEGLPEAVEPFVTTHWSQSKPYNLLCPSYTTESGAKQYPTGCVATAMAQIMNCFKYPEHGTSTRKYRFNPGNGVEEMVVVKLDDIVFDWDNMLDTYSSGNYNDAQANAVANLMMACGASVEMTYTQSGSGAYSYLACNAMRNYFGFDRGLPFHFRQTETVEEFNKCIYEALADGQPVEFGANKGTSGSGHEFVLDGYDADGLVHVNWGWGITGGDGYFDIAGMNGYSEGQNYFPLTNKGRYPKYISKFAVYNGGMTASIADNTHLAVNTGQAVFANVDAETYKGSIYVVAKNLETGVSKSIATQALSGNALSPFVTTTGMSKQSITIVNKITDGRYRLFLGTKSDQEDDFSPMRTADGYTNSYTLSIQDGKIASLTADSDTSWMTDISEICQDANVGKLSSTKTYNLAGQRVSPSSRGIVVRQGKKILMRNNDAE